MGFMKFMKKDKGSNLADSLDIPPPPPPPSSGPPVKTQQPAQPLPSFSAQTPQPAPVGKPQPSLSLPPGKQQADNMFPPLGGSNDSLDIPPISGTDDNFPPLKEKMPPLPPLQPRMPEHRHSFFHKREEGKSLTSKPLSFEDLMKSPPPSKSSSPSFFRQGVLHSRLSGNQIFIEVTRYKQILRDLNNIKKSLKQSDSEVNGLVGDFADEERTFSKLHADLIEVEKKLVELENSIFTN